MKDKKTSLWPLPLTALLGLACSLSQLAVPTPGGNDRVATVVAQTLAALDSLTPPPTETPTSAPPTASETPSPTATTFYTPTTAPTATATPIPCNWAALVKDISVPDGTDLEPGQSFTKTWRVRNIGRCAWDEGYSLVFSDGDHMDGPDSVELEKPVAVDSTVDISVRLKAPSDRGHYQGYWRLRGNSGARFGIGPTADGAIWVDIEVVRPKKSIYSFVDDACAASWSTDDGDLPCPGTAGAAEGFVVRVDNPALEGKRVENEPGLWTQPPASGDGWIRGEYPSFEVKKGDHFRALLACQSGASGCNVKFLLQRRIGSGEVKNLASWTEKLDGRFQLVDFDLSSLAGKKVNFILAVDSRGDPAGDEALWVQPRIVR